MRSEPSGDLWLSVLEASGQPRTFSYRRTPAAEPVRAAYWSIAPRLAGDIR
jgi:hypothetical protein